MPKWAVKPLVHKANSLYDSFMSLSSLHHPSLNCLICIFFFSQAWYICLDGRTCCVWTSFFIPSPPSHPAPLPPPHPPLSKTICIRALCHSLQVLVSLQTLLWDLQLSRPVSINLSFTVNCKILHVSLTLLAQTALAPSDVAVPGH